MKLAIISDLHIGKRMYRTDENGYNKYEQLGYLALEKNMEIIKVKKPDLIINAGDIFEIPNPSVLAMNKYFNSQKMIEGIPTMTILGNHDFAFNNKSNKCSAAAMINHTYFADYEIKTIEIEDILFVMMPYVYDTNENIERYLNECGEIARKAKNKKKILVTHGVTEKYYNDFLIGDKLMFSDELVGLFNLVIIGHIHSPFEYKQGKTLVISPGAMIDYQAYVDRTGPVFLNTDDWTFSRELVKTPHIVKATCNDENINDFLNNVEENIYHISYDGDPDIIDNDLFIMARDKAVNITIDIADHKEEVEVEEEKHSVDIYEWIKVHYPDFVDTFEKAKEAIAQK